MMWSLPSLRAEDGFSSLSMKGGVVLAAASGVPPEWVTDIGGAEAWTIYQAALGAMPGPAGM